MVNEILNYVVSRGKENWERDELFQNRWELVPGWQCGRWCGERTQAVVVESLPTCPQTTICPSCLLLNSGSGRVGVTMPGARFSVSLDERRRAWMNHISHQLDFERNARITSFFSCRMFFTFSFDQFDVEAETPILWPPDAERWLIWKDPNAGNDWGQEEKGMTEDEIVGWHHWHNGHGFGWTPGVGDEQGGLACCGSWGRKESDMTEQLNWTAFDQLFILNRRLQSHLWLWGMIDGMSRCLR